MNKNTMAKLGIYCKMRTALAQKKGNALRTLGFFVWFVNLSQNGFKVPKFEVPNFKVPNF